MTITKIAGTVVREGTSLALSAARHPVATTAGAIGLARGAVRGVIGVGEELLHGHRSAPTEHAPTEHASTEHAPAREESPTDSSADAPSEPQADVEVTAEPDEPESPLEEERAQLPGPDLFEPPMTDPADLPEPIVITADDEPAGEEFHTEPKASSRVSAHEGLPGDREEADGYAEEIPAPEEQPELRP
jgi:hypothetical protein